MNNELKCSGDVFIFGATSETMNFDTWMNPIERVPAVRLNLTSERVKTCIRAILKYRSDKIFYRAKVFWEVIFD